MSGQSVNTSWDPLARTRVPTSSNAPTTAVVTIASRGEIIASARVGRDPTSAFTARTVTHAMSASAVTKCAVTDHFGSRFVSTTTPPITA